MKILTIVLWIVFSAIGILWEHLGKDGDFMGIIGQMHFCALLIMMHIDRKTTVTINTKELTRRLELSKPKL